MLTGLGFRRAIEELQRPAHRVGVNRIAIHTLRIDAQQRHVLPADCGAGIEEYVVRHIAR